MIGRAVLSAALGVGLGLAFPPYDLWWMAPLVVAGFTLVLHRARVRHGLLHGFSFGLGFFLVHLRWLDVIGVDAWLLLAGFMAVYMAGLGAAVALLTRLPWWPVWVACAWVLEEWVRSRVPFGGFSWGRLAFAQPDTPFTPYAAVAGAPLVTVLVALCGALLAAAVLARGSVRVGALAAAVGVVGVGLVVPLPTSGEPVQGAVVQGNVPRLGLDFLGQREQVLRNHVAETEQLADDVAAGEEPQPDIVIWPENSTDIDPYADAEARDLVQEAVDAIDAPTLVGAVVAVEDGRRLENTSIVWTPEDGPGETYVKRHPVPFGEYVPFRSTLERWISRLERVRRDFRAGDEVGVLDLGDVRVAVAICFEVADDGIVRDGVVEGGRAIVVQTNNATYGRTGQPDQQLAITQLRAVEHGRPILVAATSGISAVIAADGTIDEVTEEFVAESLVAEIRLRDATTLADRLGPWPERAIVLVSIVALALAIGRTRTRDRRTTTEDRAAV